MKNIFKVLAMAGVLSLGLVGCSSGEEATESGTEGQTTEAVTEKAETEKEAEGTTGGAAGGKINVVSREDGSGTRDAFTEIVGVVDDNGNDLTFEDAAIQSSTDAAMSTVAGDPNAVGYISLGSLNDTVKALKVNGAEPTKEAIQTGDYKIARPFNIAYQEAKLSEGAKDFVNFVFSKEGQEVVEAEGYIAIDTAAPAYEPASEDITETITIGGSTSVAPVIEKIVEAYKAKQPNADITIEATGSGAGVTGATNGTLDIGMASRELDEAEQAAVQSKPIALDGIVVIVNKENSIEDISLDNIKAIYLGELKTWEEAGK